MKEWSVSVEVVEIVEVVLLGVSWIRVEGVGRSGRLISWVGILTGRSAWRVLRWSLWLFIPLILWIWLISGTAWLRRGIGMSLGIGLLTASTWWLTWRAIAFIGSSCILFRMSWCAGISLRRRRWWCGCIVI